ncbi:sn-glycerol-3-phosphate ABC transporter ATP-binding protein UgpC [Sporolactobacillus shoreicorticis]|uniref:ABC transporter ATP-binding protein n=1 Tax=Sporolactobacillus shoreicorticis TaxID=1923877 RepID=A0ABW5S6J1_9BACL|nr:sn-glycerol-3-phosphate ABC transporter ATP-binding protein UgpC [Sporolactobacillus shoreicorticis]MCO7124240.1 sn-glycerol-3-phosphate ABC transporter ATP-binding protein UgpC [Sporolactobacillus shoreicorticis]
MSFLTFKHVSKQYVDGKNNQGYAVRNANFSINKGELVVFVGPSGCGKSTFLRMLAGLEEITSGEIILEEQSLNDVDVKMRDIAMVFQDYALYPHMSVEENLSFGLKNQRKPKQTIMQKVDMACSLLDLSDFRKRMPKQLSGGQRQRVALGRAIVKEPKVFLLDEPLSNLDAKLRVQTRKMIADLHNRLKATMIYVTHDQTEAMTLADKIVVMNKGIIQQIDTPERIYLYPSNLFVAGFIGSPPMNLLRVKIKNSQSFKLSEFNVQVPDDYQVLLQPYVGKEVILGIRPEYIQLSELTTGESGIKPNLIEFLGSENLIYFMLEEGELIVKKNLSSKMSPSTNYGLKIKRENMHFFDPISGEHLKRRSSN